MAGIKVFEQLMNDTAEDSASTLFIHKLPTGIYLLRITANGSAEQRKIIIE